MSAPVLSSTAIVICPHAGRVTLIPTQSRVLIEGQPVLLASDTGIVSGCSRAIQEGPHCVVVSWLDPAQRVRINGVPVLLSVSTGLAEGSVVVASAQSRVRAA